MIEPYVPNINVGNKAERSEGMTREEAITNLKMIRVAFVEPVTEEQAKLIDDTFDMAIKALEQEPCDYYDTYNKTCRRSEVPQEPCEDAISRAEAKRIVDFYARQIDGIFRVNESIDNLPSVQPKPKIDILDKIRDEIEQMNCIDYVKPVTVDEVLQIIDKYRVESEE